MTLFYAERGGRQIPLRTFEDVQPFLSDPEGHWQDRFSAKELARRWFAASGLPLNVSEVLGRCEPWAGARLLQGLFEAQTDLGTRGRASQTDLLAVCAIRAGLGIVAVEGKVHEAFAKPVAHWLAGQNPGGRETRLADLCRRLQLDPDNVGHLRYQLFHRSVAALIEAKRMGTKHAVLLVHSFARSPDDGHHADFAAFVAALAAVPPPPNGISEPVVRDKIELRFAWVAEPLPVG